jgi:TonB family protein
VDDIFSYGWSGIKKFFKENLVAILYTVIFHLVILIVFVFAKVDGLKNGRELGVELEFEERTLEEILAEEVEDVPAEWMEQVMLERELASNRAVNLNAENEFSEDISTDEYVQDLLDQIDQARDEEDKEKLDELQAILATADYVPPAAEEEEDQSGEFSGPTTITYEFLEEPRSRGKAMLTIPIYRCQGSGVVRVEVSVAPDGSVRSAEIRAPIEGSDKVCFGDAALAAARSSRFRIELNGPSKHRALITYAFVAQ